MAFGGNPELKTNVELIYISSKGGICTKPAGFPDGKDLAVGAVGAYINKIPTICGGINGGRECHGYKFELQTWIKLPLLMRQGRQEAAGIQLVNGSWIIFGGKLQSGEVLGDTEVLKDYEFQFGQVWPVPVWGHCSININVTHALIAGGENSNGYVSQGYSFEFENAYWKWIVDIIYKRSGHICGKIESDNDVKIIIAGGKNVLDVEVISLYSEKITVGPPLPHEMYMAAYVQLHKTFIITGGSHMGDCPVKNTECISSKYIYKFENLNEWRKILQEMRIPRFDHIVMTIPKEDIGTACSKLCSECSGIIL